MSGDDGCGEGVIVGGRYGRGALARDILREKGGRQRGSAKQHRHSHRFREEVQHVGPLGFQSLVRAERLGVGPRRASQDTTERGAGSNAGLAGSLGMAIFTDIHFRVRVLVIQARGQPDWPNGSGPIDGLIHALTRETR